MRVTRFGASTLTAIFLAAILLVVAATAPPVVAGETTDASSAFERIKSLSGTWRGETSAEGEEAEAEAAATPEVVHEFRVSAGGTVVMEVMGPDSEYEMINMYHLDGEDLVLTHYCVVGNAPSYRARAGESANELVYECQGGANLKSEDEAHMHVGQLFRKGEDHISTRWLMQEKGETTYAAEFELVRVER